MDLTSSNGARPTLSVLMPVYNEIDRVEHAIDAVLGSDLQAEIELLVVDDGSSDGTRELLRSRAADPRMRVLEHAANQGKGSAVRTALAAATGEYAAIFDADLEYDFDDLGALLTPLVDGRANACFGVRAFDGYTAHSFWFVVGNRGVTLACNVLFNVYLHDIMTCHKVMRTELFQRLELEATGFAIEPEITARLIQQRERIYEVPVHYRARSFDEGKKLQASDGLRTIATLVRCRLRSPNRLSAPATVRR